MIITLTTDFGSFYPAQMKGVILSRTTDVQFVDIAHDIPPQDVRAGAFALLCSAPYFPEGMCLPQQNHSHDVDFG
jgi:S-adenosylmethionine hydrolase